MGFITGRTEPEPVLYEINSLPRPTIIDFHNILRIEIYSEYCRIIDLKNNTIQLSHEWAKIDPIFCTILNKEDNIVTPMEFDELLSIAQKRYIPIFFGETDESYY